MASLIDRPNGHRWVQFKHAGQRHTVRLGPVTRAAGREVKSQIEFILQSKLTGEPLPRGTVRWLSELSPEIRKKLAATGLVAATHDERAETLTQLIEYVARQYEENPANTRRNMRRAADALVEKFGKSRSIDSITTGDADEFRRRLRRQGLGETTVTAICKKAKTHFSMALKKRWIGENPFADMKGWTHTDEDRRFFIDRAMVAKLMRVCEPKWQLIIALARFGGVQAPSEMLALRWEWVDWEADRFTVYKPKTDTFREVPIFPELKPYLEKGWELAGDGAEFVVDAGQGRGEKALYSAFRKRIERAGITPWPKLFVNLRSSRETELVEEYPVHVAAAWLGNSPQVAAKHYLQVTDAHFSRAIASQSSSNSGAKRDSGSMNTNS